MRPNAWRGLWLALLALALTCGAAPARAQVIEFLAVPSAEELAAFLASRPAAETGLRRAETPRVIRDAPALAPPAGTARPASPRPPSAAPASPAAVALPDAFPYASARLPPRIVELLDNLAVAMRQTPEVLIVLSGHTDSTGDPALNDQLSLRRAEAARRHLVEQRGISVARVAIVGVGSVEPLPGLSPAAAQNRRIQIRRVTVERGR
jgi:outer membrane protein OmpA-like peptidoglycan-associated protein